MAVGQMNKQDLEQLAREAEGRYGIPSGVLLGLIEQESRWDPTARNRSGAIGLTQIVPRWHPNVDPQRLLSDPAYAIDTGAKIFSDRLKARNGDVAMALADYNFGQGNIEKWKKGSIPLPLETRNYVPQVLSRAAKYGADVSVTDIEKAKRTYQTVYNPNPKGPYSSARVAGNNVQGFVAALLGEIPVTPPEQNTGAIQVASADARALDIDSILQRIDNAQNEIAAAQTEVDTITIEQKSELAKQAKDIQRLFGLDPATTDGEIVATAEALRIAQGELVANTRQLQQDQQSPLFAIGDLLTGGKVSAMHRQRINASQTQITSLTDALGKLQQAAAKQQVVGQAGTYSLAEEEVKARARLNQAKAMEQSTKLGLREEIAAERRNMQQQQFEARQELQTMRLEIQEKGKALDRAIKEITSNEKVSDKEAKRSLFGPTARAMGFDDVDEYIIVAEKDSFLKTNFVGPEGEMSVPMARKRIELGRATKAQTDAYYQAVRPSQGWAAPDNQANVDNPMWMPPDLRDAINKSIGTSKQTEVILNAQQRIANAKKGTIINDGSQEYLSSNPYAANFWALQSANMDGMKQQIPSLDRTLKSELYQTLAKKNEGNSKDKILIGDEEVLNTAKELVRSKVLTLDQAGKQLADYYTAAVAVNNTMHQFREIGFPQQDSYSIPIKERMSSKGFIGISPPKQGKNGQVKTYKHFDLTNETQAKALVVLMHSNGQSGFFSNALGFAAHTPISPFGFINITDDLRADVNRRVQQIAE